MTDPCSVCGGTPTRFYAKGWRCAVHTPAAEAGRPETVPDPNLTLQALRTGRVGA